MHENLTLDDHGDLYAEQECAFINACNALVFARDTLASHPRLGIVSAQASRLERVHVREWNTLIHTPLELVELPAALALVHDRVRCVRHDIQLLCAPYPELLDAMVHTYRLMAPAGLEGR